MGVGDPDAGVGQRFSALQRAEIAEMGRTFPNQIGIACFSALQRAEIAEILARLPQMLLPPAFQCSSTSRNC